MRTKLLSLSLMLVYSFVSNAQQPWRAKLFVHFLESNNQIITDTVWFGCDSLGNIGYQEGLDVFDTTYAPNRVLGFDSLVQIQRHTDCVNLKQNVKSFNIGLVEFNFYAIGNVIGVSWDTADFKYDDPVYKLRGAWISSKNAYLKDIDAYEYVFYNELRPSDKFSKDSIKVVPNGHLANECSFPALVVHFNLEVALGYKNIGIAEALKSGIEYTSFPIPTHDFLNINFRSTSEHTVQITNKLGKVVLILNLPERENVINMESLPGGVYYMTLTDEEHKIKTVQKLIILH